jgi:alpha-beta hydrolase superfamily lysophospholipase
MRGGEEAVGATPFWFGGGDRPLFGWFHAPDDRPVTGGVVLCPPLGIEAICTYFSYRVLADRLAESGLAVLRFDYDGTGDSIGDQDDPGRVEAWLESVRSAVDFVVDSGVSRVALVGIRMGAVFAAEEAGRRGGVDALVLWDPCLSGRSFLREQQAFRMLSLGGGDSDGAIDAPGLRFHAETVRGLSQLDLSRSEGVLARHALVLTHPERPRPRRLAQRLVGTEVDWEEATGQEELLDPPLQKPPYQTIDRVVGWLSRTLDGDVAEVSVPKSGPTVIGRNPCGGEIVERPVALGPLGLFGIVTEVPGAATGPTIVLVDEGNTPHIGQSRIWVELARAWAAEGLRVLRFDLSGNGDSGVRPGQKPHVMRASEAFDDLFHVRRAISPADPSNVVLVGLCSGAYQAMEEGLLAPLRGVCIINPILTFRLPDESSSTVAARRQARQRTKSWVCSVARVPLTWVARRWAKGEAEHWLEAFELGRWPAAIARRTKVPTFVWSLVNRYLLENQSVGALERLVDDGVDTLLLCGEEDLQPIKLGAERALDRLEQSNRFRLTVLPKLDHAGLLIEERDALKGVLTEHVLSRFAHGRPTGVHKNVPGRVVA